MRIEDIRCKACGAKLNIEEGADSVTCPYCNVTYKVRDMEDSGYEFEKGRLKAQREHLKSLAPASFAFIIIPIVIFVIFIVVGISVTFQGKDTKSNKSTTSKISSREFNVKYNSGRTDGVFVETDLDEVIESNKTNKDKKISVKYDGKETSDPDEITSIRKSMDYSKDYEISLDYDDEGYICTYSIEEAEKTVAQKKQELSNRRSLFNLSYREGSLSGFFINNDLDDIILSNEKNADKQIIVKYNDAESKEEGDIENIKKKISTHIEYKVRLQYDDEGFVNKYVIEDK